MVSWWRFAYNPALVDVVLRTRLCAVTGGEVG
jgi:hypothetical protein